MYVSSLYAQKYRRNDFKMNINVELKRIYLEMENKNDTRFLKIGTNKNYVHFLIQSVPRLNVVQIIKTVKV